MLQKIVPFFVLIIRIVPSKVHQENQETKKPLNLDTRTIDEYAHESFDITLNTQAQIYAFLDVQQPKAENSNGRGPIKNNILKWNQESDILGSEYSSIEVELPTKLASSSHILSFLDVIHSTKEGERMLKAEYVDSEGTSESDREDMRGERDVNNWRSLSRHRRSFEDDPEESDQTIEDICKGVPPPPKEEVDQLSCYSCESNVTNSNPKCDQRLFKYLRHSEKFLLRRQCSKGKEERYCMKRVHRRYGQRWTERGCVSSPIRVLGRDGRGVSPTKKEGGCYTYPQGKYLTTTCFCKSNLCNEAAPISPTSSLFTTTVLALSLFLYGPAFVFIK